MKVVRQGFLSLQLVCGHGLYIFTPKILNITLEKLANHPACVKATSYPALYFFSTWAMNYLSQLRSGFLCLILQIKRMHTVSIMQVLYNQNQYLV